jgi:hypothetical protein
MKRWLTITLYCFLVLSLLANLTLAQRQQRQHKPPSEFPPVYEVPANTEDLSGRFTFARVRFDVSRFAGYFSPALGDGGPMWSHDYPTAGRHLAKIIAELSKTDVTLDHNEPIFAFDDPQLFQYPLAYLCEVGFMDLNDQEITGMREYCLRGGFLIVDDFRGPNQFANLQLHLKRAFPEFEMKRLDLSHPIFNCFFSIKTLDLQPIYGPYATPEFWGLADSTGRLMMIIDFNYDVSDFWQWSDSSWFAPIEQTNDAYKFGVNYVMYALTH